MSTTRTEKKIEKELNRADKEYTKAEALEMKGKTRSAEKHENRGMAHELRADTLAGNNTGATGGLGGGAVGGVVPLSSTYTTVGGQQYGGVGQQLGGVGQTTYVSSGQPMAYQGLNYPYQNATMHPTYGYPRLNRDQKAERFEAKALEWERRGNMKKAEKNRLKAQRHRQRTQPGYVAQPRPQTYYVERLNSFDTRALQYQQMGMTSQSTRYQQRAQRMRMKHNLNHIQPMTTLPVGQTYLVGQPTTTTYVQQPGTYTQGLSGQQGQFVGQQGLQGQGLGQQGLGQQGLQGQQYQQGLGQQGLGQQGLQGQQFGNNQFQGQQGLGQQGLGQQGLGQQGLGQQGQFGNTGGSTPMTNNQQQF